jgi:hypothetical protein
MAVTSKCTARPRIAARPVLAADAEHLGEVILAGGLVPFLRPARGWVPGSGEDITDFDKQVCASGTTCYVRPFGPGESRIPGAGAKGAYILVRQLAPGLRIRQGVWIMFPGGEPTGTWQAAPSDNPN